MALSKAAIDLLNSSGVKFGEGWADHIYKMSAGDEAQNIVIGDGVIPAKIDGYIHACTLAAKALIEYSKQADTGLDIVTATSWTGSNSALHYAQWMVDFHWKIDTRTWQFMLYLFAMKWSFRDVIDASPDITDADRRDLHQLSEDFWAEVIVAYTYRMEVIERARGFAEHPDPTCGSSWQGYIYRKVWDRTDAKFEDLALPLIEKGQPPYKPYAGTVEPVPFPTFKDEVQVQPGLPAIALQWYRECKKQGIADNYLRVQLGERMVPSRFNGWWSSLEQFLRFLQPYAQGKKADASEESTGISGYDLSDFAVRFALSHFYFQLQLKGTGQQLTALVQALGAATANAWGDRGITPQQVEAFIATAVATIAKAEREHTVVADEDLPELKIVRPLHPRYAPVDPLEPLPWEVENLERYQRKMARLGYTL